MSGKTMSLCPTEVTDSISSRCGSCRKVGDGWDLTVALAGWRALPGPCVVLGQYTSEMSSVCSSQTLREARLGEILSLSTRHTFTFSSVGKRQSSKHSFGSQAHLLFTCWPLPSVNLRPGANHLVSSKPLFSLLCDDKNQLQG